MKKAKFGVHGKLVTVEEFLDMSKTADYAIKGILPYCYACGEPVDIYGAGCFAVTSRFHHKKNPSNTGIMDDCWLANRGGIKLPGGLRPSGFDEEQGNALRMQFFAPSNLRLAYSFMWQLCRKNNLPIAIFQQCIAKADRKGVWAYKDIPLWAIPYILLTLSDFNQYRFVLHKHEKSFLDNLWNGQEKGTLHKFFVHNETFVKTSDNPYPVSESAFLEKAGDCSWVSDSLLSSLIKAGTPS